MSPSIKSEPLTNHQEFGRGLRHLDRSTSLLKWNTVLMTLILVGSLVLLNLPQLLSAKFIVIGLLGLACCLNIFALFQQRHLKLFRSRLVEQMDVATKQRIRAEKFYGLSILDPLTGLYNRRFGEERLKDEIERAEKSGEPLMVLAIDLDWFKEINDTYGHATGDMVLKAFSRRLQRAIRACDVPIRVGGDEFHVILPDCPQDQVEMILSPHGLDRGRGRGAENPRALFARLGSTSIPGHARNDRRKS